MIILVFDENVKSSGAFNFKVRTSIMIVDSQNLQVGLGNKLKLSHSDS